MVQKKNLLLDREGGFVYLQRRPGGGFEDFPDPLLGFGGALEIGKCINFLSHRPALLGPDWLLFHFRQLFYRITVVSQVL